MSKKQLVATAVLLAFAVRAAAQTPAVIEKAYPEYGATAFAPSKPEALPIKGGARNLRMRVYPLILKMADKKAAVLQIEILGAFRGFSRSELTITVDGKSGSGDAAWKSTASIYGDGTWATAQPMSEAALRVFAAAKDIYVIVSWSDSITRLEVHLTGDQLSGFKALQAKYQELP